MKKVGNLLYNKHIMNKNQMLRFYYAIKKVYCETKAEATPEEMHKRLKTWYDAFVKGERRKERRRDRSLAKLTFDEMTTFCDYVVQLFCHFGVLFNSEDYKYGKIKYRFIPSTSF